jgi:hypothetical protein
MTGSAEHTRARIVLGLESGARLIWDPTNDEKCVPFANEMAAPHVGINRGGYVIAAAYRSVEVYDSKQRRLPFIARYDSLPSSPIAVLRGARTDQFAVMCQGGQLIVFEV